MKTKTAAIMLAVAIAGTVVAGSLFGSARTIPLPESAKDFDNFAAGRPPKPGEPIKGVGVIIQRRPGGSASQKLVKTDTKGKVTFVGLAPGNYSLTVQQLDSEALRQNHLSPPDNYEVEVTGAGLVGGTMNRSWNLEKNKAYEPPSATARTTSATHYAESIDFEIKDPAPVVTITIKEGHSNAITN